ncbi:hypothetical protein [Streptomyces cathayae]|uniref:Secreted peptide n=1 Tax=Streptomyces cathayae TaxID=3031124 RepID=A0ABY8JXF0_9ACTN|nr:hypothetical protein [Streptomyces sp. HUAS 5]WGD39220.1 hypothetical protein PYS65_03065 [Streptomyces sp. HUAS 5]
MITVCAATRVVRMTCVAGVIGPVVPIVLGHVMLRVPGVGSVIGRRRVVEERVLSVVVVLVTRHDRFSSPLVLSGRRRR